MLPDFSMLENEMGVLVPRLVLIAYLKAGIALASEHDPLVKEISETDYFQVRLHNIAQMSRCSWPINGKVVNKHIFKIY
jgi:hypothetical protein